MSCPAAAHASAPSLLSGDASEEEEEERAFLELERRAFFLARLCFFLSIIRPNQNPPAAAPGGKGETDILYP